MKNNLPSEKLLGTSITVAPKKDILEYIFKRLQNQQDKFYIVTPNPEMLDYAARSKQFQETLNGASVSLPDGVGVLMAGKILGKHIISRITGVDFMLDLCKESVRQAVTVGFLGGRDGVAEATAECLKEKYPGLVVKFASGKDLLLRTLEGPMDSDPRTSIFGKQQPRGHIDILFVALGFPKQEEWIVKNLPDLDATVAMGVGGAFDYVSGKVPRAPKAVRSAGLEWAFRLVRQPWRIKRQMALPAFMIKVLKERF